MRKLLLVTLACLVLISLAMAQGKLETKWHCSKATAEHKLDIGDTPDHSYVIAQGTCSSTSTNSELKEKTGEYTEFREIWKDRFTNHGRFTTTTEGGDKLYYTYEGSAPADIAKPASNHWTIHNGTGKAKGVKGSGTCSGTRTADGNSDWTCTGSLSAGK
jgi:hypothetical protein